MSATPATTNPDTERLAALRARLPPNPFRIPRALKDQLVVELKYLCVEDLLVDLVNIAKTFAVVPVSKFQVGVVGITEAGDVYLGCNVEFSGFPLNFSVHAEQCLISNLVRHGEQELLVLIVNWAPCGHCRQFLSEIYKNERLRIRILDKGGEGPQDHSKAKLHSIDELLPAKFGPGDLGIGQNVRLLRPASWIAPADAYVPEDPMTVLGLTAMNNCWAPFTSCRSAIVIRTKDGVLHSGAYMENAAYNPSLSPLQAALTSLALSRRAFSDIASVLLLELEGTISQEGVTRLLLNAIAPTVGLRVFRLPAEHKPSPSSDVS